MAQAILAGLTPEFRAQFVVVDRHPEKLEHARQQLGLQTNSQAKVAVTDADVILLAVKPQSMAALAQEIAAALPKKGALLISVAAGLKTESLERWFNSQHTIIRAMPNTPTAVGAGMTGLFAPAHATQAQKDFCEHLLRACGSVLWVNEEAQLDAVVALSGSGPAYCFKMMEAMIAAGVELGLTAKAAQMLTLQTFHGAAKLALQSQETPAMLRQKVTSKGGTTFEALKVLEAGQFEALVKQAAKAAHDRNHSLASELDPQITLPNLQGGLHE